MTTQALDRALVERVTAHLPARYAIAAQIAAWARVPLRHLFTLTVAQTDPHGFGLLLDDDHDAERFVELPDHVADELERHIRRYTPMTPNALVLSHPGGYPVSVESARRLLAVACRAADLSPLRWHELRQYDTLRPVRAPQHDENGPRP